MFLESGPLLATSFNILRRLQRLLAMLPPDFHRRSLQLSLRLLYSAALLAYLVLISRWRLAFKYAVVYDLLMDSFSRVLDVLNFGALVFSHGLVVLEVVWRNRSHHIEQQLERLRQELLLHCARRVNIARIRRYSRAIFGALLLRCLAILLFTISNQITNNHSTILIYALYSEVVLLLRFSELTLYVALLLAFYHELIVAGSDVLLQLQLTRFDPWPLRREALLRLTELQQLHGLLWETVREIERHFDLSLAMLMLKYFMDISLMPYWIYISQHRGSSSIAQYCMAVELCKLSDICVPCWLCSQCEMLQRQFRALFHGLSSDRRNAQLNAALQRFDAQLGQEEFRLSAGGFLCLNNGTLGKFIFVVVSYIVICIQFRMSLK